MTVSNLDAVFNKKMIMELGTLDVCIDIKGLDKKFVMFNRRLSDGTTRLCSLRRKRIHSLAETIEGTLIKGKGIDISVLETVEECQVLLNR
jgi:hypothetical protein